MVKKNCTGDSKIVSTVDIRIINVLSPHFIIAIIVVFLCATVCFAEDIRDEALLKRGLARYRQGKYVSARLDFSEIITHYPASKRVTTAYMMLSKTFYRLGAYDSAESTAVSLRGLFPQSRYAEWARYMIAACGFREGDFEKAISTLAALVRTTNDNELKSHAFEALRNTIFPGMNPDTFFSILEKSGIERSYFESAKISSIKKEPSLLPRQMEWWEPRSSIKIGLLAPLTGMYFDLGNELYRGVNAALQNYPEINGMPVELLVEDTESNQIQAALKARKLIKEGVIALIGPVYGESTITAALESNAYGIPFLAPTATDVGISLLGRYVFQFNQTPIEEAKALASLAVDTLGFSNSAIIASRDRWGEAISETFSQEFALRGGKVIRTEYFEPDVSVYNYNDLLMRIRNSAPESIANPDSILVIDYGTAFADTIIVKPDPSLSPQRLKPINSIDCILVSAVTDDAVKIAKQIMEYNISTVLLGDSGWSGENVSDEWNQYVEGSYLISSTTDEPDSLGSRYFSDNFSRRKSELASIISRKGYDTCAVLIHCLAQGARNPEALVKMLESVWDFRGLSSRFTIDPEKHINTAIDFTQIQNGRYVKVNLNSSY